MPATSPSKRRLGATHRLSLSGLCNRLNLANPFSSSLSSSSSPSPSSRHNCPNPLPLPLPLPLPHPTGTTISCVIESPPVVFVGPPDVSSGALLSGQILITVPERGASGDGNGHGDDDDGSLSVGELEMTLNIKVTQKQPFHDHCEDCASRVVELERLKLLASGAILSPGKHYFPFSVLLAGHLPATTTTALIDVSYEFRAELCFPPRPSPPLSVVPPLALEQTLHVSRFLPEAERPQHSIRVFPPTDIRVNAHYTPVIDPTKLGKVKLHFEGLCRLLEGDERSSCDDDRVSEFELLFINRIDWQFQEHIKAVAPACARHSHNHNHNDTDTSLSPVPSHVDVADVSPTSSVTSPIAAPASTVSTVSTASSAAESSSSSSSSSSTTDANCISRSFYREIGWGTIKDEWRHHHEISPQPPKKPTGTVDIEFLFGMAYPSYIKCPRTTRDPCGFTSTPMIAPQQCAVDDRGRDGSEIWHLLVVEAIVCQERVNLNPAAASARFAANKRMLKMSFAVTLTKRAENSSCVAWDDEAPPVYASVPPSPPVYS